MSKSNSDPVQRAIEDFVRFGVWPKKGTLPVCIRLPRMAIIPAREDEDERAD